MRAVYIGWLRGDIESNVCTTRGPSHGDRRQECRLLREQNHVLLALRAPLAKPPYLRNIARKDFPWYASCSWRGDNAFFACPSMYNRRQLGIENGSPEEDPTVQTIGNTGPKGAPVRKFGTALCFCALLPLQPTLAKSRKDVPLALLPAEIAGAKKIFLSNGGEGEKGVRRERCQREKGVRERKVSGTCEKIGFTDFSTPHFQ
jgi:hypothetical protein